MVLLSLLASEWVEPDSLSLVFMSFSLVTTEEICCDNVRQ